MSEELPQGWAVAPLREVVVARKGKKPKTLHQSAAPGRVPYLLIDQMEGKPARHFTDDPKVTVAGKDEVLVVWDGSIGKCATGLEGAVGSTIVSLKPIGVESGFLEAFVKHTRQTLLETSRGTGLQHINQKVFWELSFPLAPANEQQRIAAKLEELFGKVDACQQRLAKTPVLLKRFRQSVLAAACSGRLTADWRDKNGGEDYEFTTVEAIADYVGGFAYKSPTFLKTGKHQVIRIGNVRPLALKLEASPVFIPDDIAEQTQRFKLHLGDIVISMTGTKYKQDYGFAALVADSDGSLFLNQRVARVRCGKSVLPKFLLFWFQTDPFREFFFSGETGNVNQGNVGAGGIRNAPIELPPLAEQQEIVRRVEGLFALADQIEARFETARAQVEKLTPSLLARAFRGDLVRQDPSDEPASVLLERIKEQRDENESPKQKRNQHKDV